MSENSNHIQICKPNKTAGVAATYIMIGSNIKVYIITLDIL